MFDVIETSSAQDASAIPFTLQDILTPEFLSERWTQRSAYYPGFPDRLSSLFGWPQFNQVLQNSHKLLVPPFIGLVRAGIPLPFADFSEIIGDRKYSPYRQISSKKIEAFVLDGSTLVVNGIERLWKPLHDLGIQLRHRLGERIQVNAYYSHQQIAGFNPHYDTHDLFILQVGGSKLWKLGGISYKYPLVDQVSGLQKPWEGVYSEVLLRAGDVLYLPRGAWHSAMVSEEPSLHLSVGVHSRTQHDLLAWLVKDLVTDEDLRVNLRMPGTPAEIETIKERITRSIEHRLASLTDLDEYDIYTESKQESEAISFNFPSSSK